MEQRERIISKNFIFSFTQIFFCAMVLYTQQTIIVEYSGSLGAGDFMSGLISGAFILGSLVARLFVSSLMDRFGRKRFSTIMLGVHLLIGLLYFTINNAALLLLMRLVLGIAFGAGISTGITMGMSILPKSRYGEATGYLMLSTTLSIAAGPLLSGFIYDAWGSTGCFTSMSVYSLISFLCCFGIDPKDSPEELSKNAKAAKDARGISRFVEPKAIPISLCIFLCAFGYAAVMSFYRSYAAETSLTREFSYFYIIYAVALLVIRPTAGKLEDKGMEDHICLFGPSAQAVGLIALAAAPCMLTIVICAIGCAFGYGMLNSVCNSIACRKAPPGRLSYAVSTFWIGCDGGVGGGPMLLGLILSLAGLPAIYYSSALLSLLVLPVYLFGCMRKKN